MADFSTPNAALRSHAKFGTLEEVRAALAAGGHIETRDKSGDTPLLLASFWNVDPRVSEFLIDRGARLDAHNRSGYTILHGFSRQDFVDMAALALGHGITPDVATRDGTTPLICAARSGRRAMVEFLLARGAAPAASDHQRRGALHWLGMCGQQGDLCAIEPLLAAGCDVHATDKFGETPLSCAAMSNYVAACVRLLAAGADPRHRANDRKTALHYAAQRGSAEAALVLLQAGADPLARDSHQSSFASLSRKNPTLALAYDAWCARNAIQSVLDQRADWPGTTRADRAGHPPFPQVPDQRALR